ncbi:MAG: MFS transporter [Phocaeicola sp.]
MKTQTLTLTARVPSTGLVTLIAAIAVQLCIGTSYIWSIFQSGIAQSIFDGDHALASLSFSIQLIIMTIGSITGGQWMNKYSMRTIITIGFLFMSSGFFLGSLTTSEFPYLLWLTYGALCGFGMGLTYSTTIACAQEWYPGKKGLVTGIIVSALGFGSVLFAPIAKMLIEQFGGVGQGELGTLKVISVIFLVVGLSASTFIHRKPKSDSNSSTTSHSTAKHSLNVREALHKPQFYGLILSFCLATIGGLMMIGFAQPIAEAKGLGAAATLGVLLLSIFNSAGRILWGFVSDKLGRRSTILILLVGSSIMSLIVNGTEGWYVLGTICLIGLFYGGLLSNFPTITAELFGSKFLGALYGIVLLGFGIGALVSSFVAGYYKNLASEDISLMNPAFIIAAACGAVSTLIMIVIYATRKSIR